MSYHHGDLKSALLEKAEEVIAEQGLDAVKLSTLAKDLGVSHSAPARHFQDRNALLVELAIRGLEALMRDFRDADGMHHSNPRVRLNTLLKIQLHSVVKRPAHFHLLGNPEISRLSGSRYDKLLTEYSAFYSRCVRDAQADGWRADENPEHVAMLALALAVGLQTSVRFSSKARGKLTSNVLVKSSRDVRNAMKAIDLFIPCP